MIKFQDIVRSWDRDGPVRIADSWRQGRTAYGGLTAALCVEAALRDVPDLPLLRSIQVNFTGPVLGDPVFETRLLRQGRNVTSVSVEAHVDRDPVGNALCIFGQSRESALVDEFPAPDVPAPEETDDFFLPQMVKFAPNFTRNFEVRLAGGHRPVSGAAEGRILAWARHKDPGSREGVSSLVCLGDVLPPAGFSMVSAPCPISSMNWMLNVVREPETEDGWYLIESVQSAARDGYSSQSMRFWNRRGQLVAEGLQAVAVFA